MIEIKSDNLIALYNMSFGEYCFVFIDSDTNLLIDMFKLKPDMLINNIIVGNDKM